MCQAIIVLVPRNPDTHIESNLQVCLRGDIARKLVHPKLGAGGEDLHRHHPALGRGAHPRRLCSTPSYDHSDQDLYGTHLLRDLAFIYESNGIAWAKNMKRHLQQTDTRVSRRSRKRLTKLEAGALKKRYYVLLAGREQELPPIPAKRNGQRDRVAQSGAHNLWERPQEHKTAVRLNAPFRLTTMLLAT